MSPVPLPALGKTLFYGHTSQEHLQYVLYEAEDPWTLCSLPKEGKVPPSEQVWGPGWTSETSSGLSPNLDLPLNSGDW